MPKPLLIFWISARFWILWILAIPWFVFGLNRRITRQPAIRKTFVPQPSRLILQSFMARRRSPDQASR